MDVAPLIITLTQLHDLAGCYHADSDFERDAKVMAWIGPRSYRVVQHRDQAINTDSTVQILIIKEN
jgi:hypothetical protein